MDPGMDGLDTYKCVLEIEPRQKALIVSGFSESDRVHDAQVLGARFYQVCTKIRTWHLHKGYGITIIKYYESLF